MANNATINLVSLDFDTQKADLISYFKSRPKLKDYDYSGSSINLLIDILTYNSVKGGFYLNMSASERYLDSAQIRKNVVSKAKELNYIPGSYKSSMGVINAVFPQSNLTSFVIPSGTRFLGQNANGTFTFLTTSSVTLYPSNGVFTASNLEIFEGKNITENFIINYNTESQRFIISNETIDINSLLVTVSEGANNTIFTEATSLYGLDNQSNVYFLQATGNSQYELVFGDNVFGRYPNNFAVITTTYRTCHGTDAEGSTNFTLSDNLGSYNGLTSAITPTINVVATSYGSANIESIDSIKYRAPRHYQTQDRAITINDYKDIIKENFPNIKAVHAYGGEEVSGSVQYGKTFIVPVTFAGTNLSDVEKVNIKSFFKDKITVGFNTELVDPDYLYLTINSQVYYDSNSTTLSPDDIKSEVANNIELYNSNTLSNFDITFDKSDFVTAISNSDVSIKSNITEIIMKKQVQPILNSLQAMTVNYFNSLEVGSVYSTSFLSGGKKYIYTDYNPNSNNYYITQSNTGLVISSITNNLYLKDITVPGKETYSVSGTIDYINGTITMNAINVNDFLNNDGIVFYAISASDNIIAKQNNFMEIDTISGINIQVFSTSNTLYSNT